jgi:hypothetical protein
VNYLKHGRLDSEADRLKQEAKPLTPRREMRRSAWGSLISSLQTVPGLCPASKCFRKEGHDGDHYPT